MPTPNPVPPLGVCPLGPLLLNAGPAMSTCAHGMLTAGLFLQEFVGEGIPWAHVDIAGPAFNSKGPKGHTPKGGTGFGVGTLLSLVESSAS